MGQTVEMFGRLPSSLARRRVRRRREASAARQSLIALAISAVTSLFAGLLLGAADGRLAQLPGLFLMVPAAIAFRGNVFGTLGSRLGTAIHAGTFRVTLRPDTVLGQNVLAAGTLSLALSVVVAVLGKGMAIVFHVANSITLGDFIVISVLGGMLASAAIVVVTVMVAAGSVRFGWDLDDVSAPVISVFGDVSTIPALLLAAELTGHGAVSPLVASLSVLASVVALAMTVRSRLADFRRVVWESLPVLSFAALLDLLAGATVEGRAESFFTYPALLVLLPGFLSTAGALGGILSSRLATKFHLGLVEPAPWPPNSARTDIAAVFTLAVPVFAFAGVISHLGAVGVGWESPGILDMSIIAVAGGVARDPVRRDGVVVLHDGGLPVRARSRHLRHPDRGQHARPDRRLRADPGRRGGGCLVNRDETDRTARRSTCQRERDGIRDETDRTARRSTCQRERATKTGTRPTEGPGGRRASGSARRKPGRDRPKELCKSEE